MTAGDVGGERLSQVQVPALTDRCPGTVRHAQRPGNAGAGTGVWRGRDAAAPLEFSRLLGKPRGMRTPQVTVVGAGSWGTTVASLAARNAPALLWARRPELAEQIANTHENPDYLAGLRQRPGAAGDLVAADGRRAGGCDLHGRPYAGVPVDPGGAGAAHSALGPGGKPVEGFRGGHRQADDRADRRGTPRPSRRRPVRPEPGEGGSEGTGRSRCHRDARPFCRATAAEPGTDQPVPRLHGDRRDRCGGRRGGEERGRDRCRDGGRPRHRGQHAGYGDQSRGGRDDPSGCRHGWRPGHLRRADRPRGHHRDLCQPTERNRALGIQIAGRARPWRRSPGTGARW